MIIRPATRADIASMLLLTENTPMASRWTGAQYERLYDPSAPRRITLISERHPDEVSVEWNSQSQNSEKQHSTVQAFITALVVADEWEIENVVVAAGVRRRGLGTRLLSELIHLACADHARALFLEVRESNIAARNLYKNAGFRETGRRPCYYSDPTEDAILYRHTFA